MTEIQVISGILMLISIICNLTSILMCKQPINGEESEKHRNVRLTLLCCGVSLCIISLFIQTIAKA